MLKHLNDMEIQELLDKNFAAVPADKRAHFDTCQQCQQALQNYRSLSGHLSQEKGFELPLNFSDSVLQNIQIHSHQEEKANWLEISVWVLGLAGAIGVSIYSLGWNNVLGNFQNFLNLFGGIIEKNVAVLQKLVQNLNINLMAIGAAGFVLIVVMSLDYLWGRFKHKIGPFVSGNLKLL
jgi:hypothetical protein